MKYIYITILCFLCFTNCNSKKADTQNQGAIHSTIQNEDSDKVQILDEEEDDFFKDWDKQPFKGTMLFDGSSDEDKLKKIMSGNDPAPDVQIKYNDYKLVIYNYGVDNARIDFNNLEEDNYDYYPEEATRVVRGFNDYDIVPREGKDTLQLYEYVFEDLSNKQIEILPRNPNDRFELAGCTSMRVAEQYNYDNPAHRGEEWWDEKRIKWENKSTYKQIADSAKYFFKIPIITDLYEPDFVKCYKNLNLRDTLVDRSGETDNIATLVYKNVPAVFYVEYGIIRIKHFNKEGELLDTKYIKIFFSYGC